MPTRRTSIPCHCKFDTEALSQLFIPYKKRVEARKLLVDRADYNEWVWDKAVDIGRLKRRVKSFKFHHEISTDGVSASVLFSRPSGRDGSAAKKKRAENIPVWSVGVDPGRKNIITALDQDGRKLRYTSSQRTFESKLTRYRVVIEREKRKAGITEKEAELSTLSHRTVDPEEYFKFLSMKSKVDEETRAFYLQERWRSWKFRIYSNRRSSEDRLANRLGNTFGWSSMFYYGDWSSSCQQKGCTPTPNAGMRLLLRKKFLLKDVSEFRTSKVCNVCMGELKRYKKVGGRLSYSRLFCNTCSNKTGRPVFVNRDVNAAANILLAGTSSPRPPALCRTASGVSTASLEMGTKSALETYERKLLKLSVAAERASSDPSPIGTSGSLPPTADW